MKASIAGAAVSPAVMRTACSRAEISAKDLRTIDGRAWIALPVDVVDGVVDRLAQAVARTLTVVAVEIPLGGRGEGLHASRYTVGGAEEDLSGEATEILHEWLADGSGGGFDEDVAAQDLAWALVDHDPGGETPDGAVNREALWAKSLLEKLVAAGTIELRGKQLPMNAIAQVLHDPGAGLGERLLDALINSPAVDEVFADASEVAAAARATKPKR